MPPGRIKFDRFLLDCDRYELLRADRLVKLERIPMELLILLVRKEGQLATRQEIVDHLWGSDVFLDTEHGINTAVRKVRRALRDHPEQPRFIQTVTGKGYRFIGGQLAEAESGERLDEEETVQPPPAAPSNASPERPWRSAVAGAILAVLALVAVGVVSWREWPLVRQDHRIRSIAVLPLANNSGDASQNYFADGMTDELITMLAKNPALAVTSRTSVMQYRSVQRPLRDIARELRVDAILEGSVTKSVDRVHMTVQLIRAANDTHIWAESYDRDPAGAYDLPDDIAKAIGRKLNYAAPAAAPARHINAEAHDAYLQGRYFWFTDDLKQSQPYLEKAIQLQPDYAAAWSGLADTFVVLAIEGSGPPREIMAKAEAAAKHGMELDPTLAAAHNTMAGLYFFDYWDWQRAEAEVRRAIELDPRNAEFYHLYSYILLACERSDEALREQRRSTELDPFSRPWALGRLYLGLRQYDVAINELRLREKAVPGNFLLHFAASRAYYAKGMWNDYERELEEGVRSQGPESMAIMIHNAYDHASNKSLDASRASDAAKAMRLEEWRLDREKEEARKHYVSALELAFRYATLHRKRETLDYLEQAYRERSPFLVFVQNDPEFDFVHSEERYRALVKAMRLPPAY